MKGSNNEFPSVLFLEGTTPTSPAAGDQRLFVRSSDHVLCLVNSSGTVVSLPSNPMTAVGDLAQGGTSGAPARLGAGTAGQFLMAAGAATSLLWASRELDYVEKTSATTVTATTEGTADTVVTGSAVSYDGATAVLIDFYCESIDTNASTGAQVTVVLYDGAASIGKMGLIIDSAAGALYVPVHASRRLTPSNASHTYSIRAYTSTGTAHVNAGAGGNGAIMPAFIRITRAV